MFLEYFDFKRSAWDPQALAGVLTRLQESGYQGLTFEVHHLLGRYTHAHADRSLASALARGETFADVLIPPAQPHARVMLHHRPPDVLRVVVAGRSQHEVRMAVTALKMHLEAVFGSRINDMLADEGGRASLARFRREVLPSLHLTGNGDHAPEIRNTAAAQLLMALRHQPVFRGKPTVLGSQVAALAPDRPPEQTREALEQLLAAGIVERWHVVVCREGGQWLGVSTSMEEMKTFISLTVECPHCGRRVSDEQPDVAYRLGDKVQAYLSDNRWMCDVIETALRRFGVEAVAVQPGAGPVDGAACYQGAVILFRAKDGTAEVEDLTRLQDQARMLEQDGWRVFPVLISDAPASAEVKDAGITVIDSMASLDSALDTVLRTVREVTLGTLLPPLLHPPVVALLDLLPGEPGAPHEP